MSHEPRHLRRALAISAAVHALVLAWLSAAPAPAKAPHVDIEIEFHEVARATPPPVPPSIPVVPPKPMTAPLAVKGAAPSHRSDAPKVAVAPAVVAPPAERPAPISGADVPAAAPVRVPDLRVAAGDAALRVEPGIPVPTVATTAPGRGLHAPEGPTDPNARVQQMAQEVLGPSRVERGMVDPYFAELGHALTEGWHPDTKAIPQTAGATLVRLFESDEAQRFGKTGSPFAAGDPGPAAWVPDGANSAPGREELALARNRAQLGLKMRELAHTDCAVVRLTQSLGGVLLSVELVQPSAFPALDADLLLQLRRETLRLPVPPHEGMGIHDPIRSLWAFQLTQQLGALVTPGVGGGLALTVSGTFDETSRTGSVDRPGGTPFVKHVELLSLE